MKPGPESEFGPGTKLWPTRRGVATLHVYGHVVQSLLHQLWVVTKNKLHFFLVEVWLPSSIT